MKMGDKEFNQFDVLRSWCNDRYPHEGYEEWRTRQIEQLPIILKAMGYHKLPTPDSKEYLLDSDEKCDLTDAVGGEGMNWRCFFGHDWERLSEPLPLKEENLFNFNVANYQGHYAAVKCLRCGKVDIHQCFGEWSYSLSDMKTKEEIISLATTDKEG